jgi:tRNA(Leu) C34 or U34 (ribose-2'-O)-methylase TrmL
VRRNGTLADARLKNSLNVSVAFGIAVYEVLRRYCMEYSMLDNPLR